MYLNSFGSCSALIHFLARRPKIVLVCCLVGAIAYMQSPLGPGYHTGLEKKLDIVQTKVEKANKYPSNGFLRARFLEVWKDDLMLTDSAIEAVVSKFECPISKESVKGDRKLMEDVAFLLFLDAASLNGIADAKGRLQRSIRR